MNRRSLLGLVAAGFAGCLGDDDGDSRTPTPSPTPTAVPDLPRDGSLDGWPTYRGTAANTGRVQGTTGPGPDAELRWEHRLSDSERRTPFQAAAAGEVVFAADPGGARTVVAVDATDGQVLAEELAADDRVVTEPIIADGSVYYGERKSELIAREAATGHERWRVQTTTFDREGTEVTHPLEQPPTIVDERVYTTDIRELRDPGGSRAMIRCYEEPDGGECWNVIEMPSAGDRTSIPRYDGDRLLFQTEDTLLAFDLNWREIDWEADLPEMSGDKASSVDRTPAVADDIVVVATQEDHRAFDATHGTELWSRRSKGPLPQDNSELNYVYTAAISDGVVYAGTNDGRFLALDLETGEELWTTQPDPELAYWTAPGIGDGAIFVGAQGHVGRTQTVRDPTDSHLYIFDAETGEEMGHWKIPGELSPPVVTEENAVIPAGPKLIAVG